MKNGMILHLGQKNSHSPLMSFQPNMPVFIKWWPAGRIRPAEPSKSISKSQQQAFKLTDFSVQKEEKKQQLALLAKLVSEGNRSSLFQKASRFFTISTMDFSFPCSCVFKWGKTHVFSVLHDAEMVSCCFWFTLFQKIHYMDFEFNKALQCFALTEPAHVIVE